MPPLWCADLKDWAVLWPFERGDHRGTLLRGEPEEIRVRWDWRTEDVVDATGQRIRIDATVAVGQDIAIDSWIWLGRLDDWYEAGSAPPESASGLLGSGNNLCQVRLYLSAKDIKNRETRRQIGVVRFANTLPELS